jgi:type IV pilus assembly protein PilB
MRLSHTQVGQILLEKGLITRQQLAHALDLQRQNGKKLGHILMEQNVVSDSALTAALSEKLKIPQVQINPETIDTAVINTFPRDFAVKHRAIPIYKIENDLTVAMADPTDIFAIDSIRELTKCRMHPVIATESEIDAAINRFYSFHDSVREVIKNLDEEDFGRREIEVQEVADSVNDPAVIRLVHLVLTQAVKQGASDIHVEPSEHALRIRYRIDGVLREVSQPPKDLQAMIAARIKIMANLNISEKRLPQDGRLKISVDKRSVDVRVSLLPTVWGEKVVLRILDKGRMLLDLDHLGLSDENLKMLRALVRRPEGILLITGPTGSGKTSTLYAVLNEIDSAEKNIVTVEDPVEYLFPSINQVQVNEKTGLTFAAALRAILRQDPNIIMIGEMRDQETAEIGIRSALTGHLVLSTLHTNSACGALTRLVDMGIEPFLVSSSIIGILAQRLVRKICPNCRTPLALDGLSPKSRELAEARGKTLYHGRGCAACSGAGYQGRTGIHELAVIDHDIERMIMRRESSEAIHKAAVARGMKTVRSDGLERAFAGITTLDEVFRVT